MSVVIINGKTYGSETGSVSIINGKVIIDGKDMTPDSKEINVTINGNVETLNVDTANKIQVIGSCGSLVSHNGEINIDGNVSGNVENRNGNIDCMNVGGNVSTRNGNIKHRKS